MSPVLMAFFAIAALLRLGSVLISRRNEARLRREGAEEYGATLSRGLAALHSLFYGAAFLEGLWRGSRVDALTVLGLVLYGFAMLVLGYVIYELGRLWSVKLLIAPGHTLRRSWLFRTVRHPNYYLNILPELVGLVLVLKAWIVFVLLFPCYVVVLFRRIQLEEAAMRRRVADYP